MSAMLFVHSKAPRATRPDKSKLDRVLFSRHSMVCGERQPCAWVDVKASLTQQTKMDTHKLLQLRVLPHILSHRGFVALDM